MSTFVLNINGESRTVEVDKETPNETSKAVPKDLIDFRLKMLVEDSRLANVLKLVKDKSEWNKKLPEGRGRWVAIFEVYGSFIDQVTEILVTNNRIKLDSFVSAIDYGIVINPDTVEAQMEGAIIFAPSAALKGEIIIRNSGIDKSNYHDYPILEYSETLKIETDIVKNDFPVGGVGEVGVSTSTPALINAIFNATGRRIRRLPVNLS